MSETPLQTNRLLKIKGPAGELVLRRLTVREAIGECFLIEAEVLSADPNIAPPTMVGKAVTCSVVHAERPERHFHGIVYGFARVGTNERNLTTYRLEARPRLFNLSRTSDSRIFQQKAVRAIIQTLVDEGSAAPVRFGTVDATQREYCTQYDETDLDFVSRLAAECGWAWWFVHEDGNHTLNFGGSNADFPMIPGDPQVLRADNALDFGTVWNWHRWSRLPTGSVVALDHDHPKLATDIRTNANTVVHAAHAGNAETFLFPSSKSVRPEVDPAKLAMEAAEAASELVTTTGNDPMIFAGGRLKVKPGLGSVGAETWVVSEIIHDAVDETHLVEGGLPSYGNRMVLMPATRPWRPYPLPRRPVIPGLQWARVTGPSGEEIHTDQHARVKVRFMWDRAGKTDDTSSRWCPVMQGLAGVWGGMQYIPRVGDWVAVSFLHGDPDHPIVLGSMYASDAPPPFALPANRTQSGYKTRSTKNGGASNFNMLKFEDLKGSELLQMQAEKDYDLLVKNDTTIYTKHDHTEKVKNNRTTTIEDGNEKLTVAKGDMSTEVSMGNQDNRVKMGNITEKVDLGSNTSEAMQSITLKVGQNSIVIDQTGITIKGITIKIEGTAMLQTKAPMAQHNADGMMIIKGGIVMIN
ncbi:type VI secretion system Vgr family protein [Roseomonas sp. CCTCC AB2023176]|uniref:type VI secretion system Vgr family protein n=1 Tax=Roseomonas sp. CCTCC AB2023176 TaxID=3342640 RepID=UPI0035D9B8C6